MSDTNYSMSFTSGALLYRESMVITEVFAETDDWLATRNIVVSENRLQMRTANASQRICREVVSRLRLLSETQLELLLDGAGQERQLLLWLAVCKRYEFIQDFAVEVLNVKFQRLDSALTMADYDAYFNAKAEWHPEVESVAASTRGKQRQIIFKMLREAGLLTPDNQIVPALLSPRLVRVIGQDSPDLFAIFPVPKPSASEWSA